MRKNIAFCLSLIPLFVLLLFRKDLIGHDIDFLWIAPLSIHFHIGVDSLSLLFLLLTALVTIFVIGILPSNEGDFWAYTAIFATEFLLFGLFTAKDLFLFFLFWEAMILPLFAVIYFYGGKKRIEAAFSFLLYMMSGSLLMMLAVLALYTSRGTFSMEVLAEKGGSEWLPFLIFLLAFAVKAPLFPFHGWLRLTYVEAPFWGTILLAALLSKGAVYAIFRIGVGFFPELLFAVSPYLIGCAALGMIYGALLACNEKNFKALLAYSSFSHINFLLAALFVMNERAHIGALLQAFNHGILIAPLFWMAQLIYQREKPGSQGGILRQFPFLGKITFFFILAAIALPGTGNFIGELLVLIGLFRAHPIMTALLASTLVLSMLYMVRYVRESLQGKPTIDPTGEDLSTRELLLSLPFAALILWIGVYPAPWIQFLEEIFTKP